MRFAQVGWQEGCALNLEFKTKPILLTTNPEFITGMNITTTL